MANISAVPLRSVKRRGLSVLDYSNYGLCGAEGAARLVKDISRRRLLTKLIVPHNELGDEGCKVLFNFLSADTTKKFEITELHLSGCGMGNQGLDSLSQYIRKNHHLKELWIQGNSISGSDELKGFLEALNESHIERLFLSTNPRLGDTFASLLFSFLATPYLRELHLSSTNLSPASAQDICSFLSSPRRCKHLQILRLNANNLGREGVEKMTNTIRVKNYWLFELQVHSNNLGGDWISMEATLSSALVRNEHLKRQTEKEALLLLHHARPLLLPPATLPKNRSSSSSSSFNHRRFPTEVILYILSFLAPHLSSTQLIHIFSYAAEPSTLPVLSPSCHHPTRSSSSSSSSSRHAHLTSSPPCVPDPTTTLDAMDIEGGIWPIEGRAGAGGCSSGKCMGGKNSLVCHRDQERNRFLKQVECEIFRMEREE